MDRFRRGGGGSGTTPSDSSRGSKPGVSLLSTRNSAAAAHRPHETMGVNTTAGDNVGSSATLFHDRNGGCFNSAAPAALAFPADLQQKSSPTASASKPRHGPAPDSSTCVNDTSGKSENPAYIPSEGLLAVSDSINNGMKGDHNAGKTGGSSSTSPPQSGSFFDIPFTVINSNIVSSAGHNNGASPDAGNTGDSSPSRTSDEVAAPFRAAFVPPNASALPHPSPALFATEQEKKNEAVPTATSPFQFSSARNKRRLSPPGRIASTFLSVAMNTQTANRARRRTSSTESASAHDASDSGISRMEVAPAWPASDGHLAASERTDDSVRGGVNDKRDSRPHGTLAKRDPDGEGDVSIVHEGADVTQGGSWTRRMNEPSSTSSNATECVQRSIVPAVLTSADSRQPGTFFSSAVGGGGGGDVRGLTSELPPLDSIMEDHDSFDELWAAEDAHFVNAACSIQKLAHRQLSIRESFARSHSALLQKDAGFKSLADVEQLVATATTLLVEMDLEVVVHTDGTRSSYHH